MVNAGDLVAKRLQMVVEMSPKISRVAFLMTPDNRNHSKNLGNLQAAPRNHPKNHACLGREVFGIGAAGVMPSGGAIE